MANGAQNLSRCPLFPMSIRGDLGLCCSLRKTRLSSVFSRVRHPNGTIDQERKTVELGQEGARWAIDSAARRGRIRGAPGVSDVLTVGDIVYVSPPTEARLNKENNPPKPVKGEVKPATPRWQLMQDTANRRRDGCHGPAYGTDFGARRRVQFRGEPVRQGSSRRDGSQARRSSRSFTQPPSTTAIRRPAS